MLKDIFSDGISAVANFRSDNMDAPFNYHSRANPEDLFAMVVLKLSIRIDGCNLVIMQRLQYHGDPITT